MEKRTRSSIHTQQLEDVPELIHRIQSFLPVDEATRTCILSKSWLQAWSTIPTLSFHYHSEKFDTEAQKENHKKLIDRTLQRYHRNNIPIKSFYLGCHIENQDSAFVAENWIPSVASKSCLKELFLEISSSNDSFTLPNELFSGENLNTIVVESKGTYRLRICSNHVIKCVSLRVLDLQNVTISDEVLDKLLSTCSVLEDIRLWNCHGLKDVKIKDLPLLRELVIHSKEENALWEINNVPSLSLCEYRTLVRSKPFYIDSLGSVTKLCIEGIMIDSEFLKTIESKFLLLENLRLYIRFYEHQSLVIKSVSLKWLTLNLLECDRQVNVEVHAPKLLYFVSKSTSSILHGLSFPTIAPNDIKLTFHLNQPLDHSFFLKMREALNLSSKFRIEIKDWGMDPSNIDVDDLRKRVSFPVTNVEEVSLVSYYKTSVSEKTQFFDPLFSICRPHYIKCSKLAVREIMEKKTNEPEDIQVQDPHNGKWESLRTSGRSILDTLADPIKFKLNWMTQ